MKQKVIVIGGGIAGLSSGIYALKCGFDVTILESHSIAGGNCTSWMRNGYLFEGGMHWLTGSSPNEPIHKMWRYVGAINDGLVIHYREPFIEYIHNGEPVRVYRNVDETERSLTELSPADAPEIKKFCNNIRKVKDLAMPVTDIRGVKTTKSNQPSMSLLFSALSGMMVMGSFSRISAEQYINKFSHEGIREMLRSCTNERTGVIALLFTLGTLARGDGGFPEGGSLPFARRMVDMFTSLGGNIQYSTRAERVIMENGKAVGVTAKGKRIDSDAVIVTADTMAIEHFFDTPLSTGWLDKMRKVTKPTMAVFLSFGINADLRNYPRQAVYKTENTITIADQAYGYISVNNYASDPVYSPEGKSALTVVFDGDTYDFWKKAKVENRYYEEKEALANNVIKAMTKNMPEIAGNVEVVDVATPLTYERYCGNWKGSWMTEMVPNMKMTTYPSVIEGLGRVYFAGQRIMPPGGLPVALMTGRTAVQYLCRDTDTLFVSEE